MNILIFCLSAIICFALLTIFRRKHDYFVLMAVAIGSACSANIYDCFESPVYLGNIILSFDSVLYTLFATSLIITLRDYSLEKYKSMAITALVAILISAFIEFLAVGSSAGTFSEASIKKLILWVVSTFGSLIGIWLGAYTYRKLKLEETNTYFIFFLLILELSVINSIFYYGCLKALGQLDTNTFGYSLLGSYIGKLFSIGLSCLSYYICHCWYYKNKEKEDIRLGNTKE